MFFVYLLSFLIGSLIVFALLWIFKPRLCIHFRYRSDERMFSDSQLFQIYCDLVYLQRIEYNFRRRSVIHAIRDLIDTSDFDNDSSNHV